MQVQKKKIVDLRPASYNPRKISDEQMKRLRMSIEEFDVVEPIVWNKQTGNVVGGHQRLKVLSEMGRKDVDVVVVDLPPSKEKALNLALNKISGEWDFPLLKDLIVEIDTGEFPIELTGFDYDELEDLISYERPGSGGMTDPDEVPEKPKMPISKPGDLWILGDHRLLCGSSLDPIAMDILLAKKKINLVFTDPPYGVSYASKNTFLNSIDKGNRIQKEIENDQMDEKEIQVFWKEAFEIIRDRLAEVNSYYIFGPQIQGMMMMMMMMMQAGLPYRHVIIWVKNNHVLGRCDYNYKHEPIFFGWTTKHKFYGYGSMKTSVWEADKPLKSDLHPTMKPVALVENAILNSSKQGDLVFDGFLGSGTTLVAAERLRRVCCAVEIDPAYVDVAVKRWENFTGKKARRE